MRPAKARTAFWDTSAIIPLCVDQRPTARSFEIAREFRKTVVWWATPVELYSALARLLRDAEIDGNEMANGVRRLNVLYSVWQEVLPLDSVRMMAQSLLGQYPLRAADALQLAAALIWCREKPQHRPFVCFDDKLAEVANRIGFSVLS
jgi:predicted nucleic acid-binding protein